VISRRLVPFVVIAGLDPAIHSAFPHQLNLSMDHRVSPRRSGSLSLAGRGGPVMTRLNVTGPWL
jgi:hypothetical protein